MKIFTWLLCMITLPLCAATIQPVPYRVPAKMPDAAEILSPSDIHLNGPLGMRLENNEKNRLVKVDLEPLLAGFRKKPGTHPWIGEHIGKWMHASSLAWAYTGDPALREKMDYAVAELIKAQEPDGYLGTYVPEKRFGLFQGADWDVWSHKYNLIGLLSYYQYTGNESALTAARKIGDLLINTFGEGKKSIISAGTHVGMAATSVLEPIVWLYRFTGEQKYLDFAQYIVRAYDEPNGPKIIATLLEKKPVSKTANSKAYEMLSNLVGLCELARVTGERRYLEAALNAWEDIVKHRLYITGSASQGEHFRGDYELPNEMRSAVSETCVITTWIQLNLQLLRLTGEARFGEQLEKTILNHLSAAQRPDGAQWCYFTSLEGTKPYGPGINCCVSSGPRGMALVPQAAWLRFPGQKDPADTIALNLFESSRLTTMIDGQPVTIICESQFPLKGELTLTIKTKKTVRFDLFLRNADWAHDWKLNVYGPSHLRSPQYGVGWKNWIFFPEGKWSDGDRINVFFSIKTKLVLGEHGNAGKAALTWGPYVMAYDQALNPGLPAAGQLGFADVSPDAIKLRSAANGSPFTIETKVRSPREKNPKVAMFVPFADAGREGSRYQIWLRAPGVEMPKNDSLSAFADEGRSRQGNQSGSITDGDTSTFVVTFDGKPAREDWFEVKFEAPVDVRRIVFAHGKNFHDGGWFDVLGGKPRIQVKREKNGGWQDMAELKEYPATTGTDSAGLRDGQTFSVRLGESVKAVAVRVIGKPACGDNPNQAFSSCAELQLFGQ